ncbi:MAG: threonine synthase [Dehalococcoidia bacterium]|nr:threonine synthase [Dehalococcoidia bacterium]
MSYMTALHCRECGREYEPGPLHVCEFCFGPLEVTYDYDGMRGKVTRKRIESGPPTMWRYIDLLPIAGDDPIEMGTGFTPLLRAENLGRELGLDELYLKNDCVNPTWSFKDRVVGVAATRARELGFTTLACASTGNLANSVSAHAAKAGMDAIVFIPSDLEQSKILGSAIYAPTLVAVNGSYDDVNRLCSELAGRYPWAFVNINVRPYYAEGSKTLGYEVAEQLGWQAPDHCVVPMASGSLYTKIWKGLTELHRLGLIDEPHTRMSGAQAEGCSPIATAWMGGTMNIRPQRPNTIAKSLAIGNPADGYYALKTMQETNGAAAAVSDDEVVEGMKLLARTEGIFAETAGGVTIAALKRLVQSGVIRRGERTVVFITGAGLKTPDAVMGRLAASLDIEATVESFEAAKREVDARVSAAPATA